MARITFWLFFPLFKWPVFLHTSFSTINCLTITCDLLWYVHECWINFSAWIKFWLLLCYIPMKKRGEKEGDTLSWDTPENVPKQSTGGYSSGHSQDTEKTYIRYSWGCARHVVSGLSVSQTGYPQDILGMLKCWQGWHTNALFPI